MRLVLATAFALQLRMVMLLVVPESLIHETFRAILSRFRPWRLEHALWLSKAAAFMVVLNLRSNSRANAATGEILKLQLLRFATSKSCLGSALCNNTSLKTERPVDHVACWSIC